jgi:transcriptional regulator with XRE-family HTH domain
MNNEEFLKSMGSRIRAARNAKGMSLRQLAPLCGVQHTHIMRIERGLKQSRITTLKSIADVLEVDVKDFFTFTA